MKWDEVSRSWNAFGDAIQARWPKLDSAEIADLDGSREAFNVYLGQVYGLTPREAREQIDEWLAGPLPLDAVASEHRTSATIRDSAGHIPAGEDVYSDDRAFGDDNIAEPPIGRT